MAHGQAEALLPMVDGALRRAGLPRRGARPHRGHHRARQLYRHPGRARRGARDCARPRSAADRRHRLRGGRRNRRPRRINCNGDLLVALESRRADFYVQLFDGAGRPLGEPAAVLPEALPGFAQAGRRRGSSSFAGDAAARAAAALGARPGTILVEDQEPRALGALRAAMRRWRGGERGEVPVQPLYLRPPDATPAAARLAPPRIASRRLRAGREPPLRSRSPARPRRARGAVVDAAPRLLSRMIRGRPERWRRSWRSPGSSGGSPGRTICRPALPWLCDLGDECEILSLGVVPERRRRGIGSALLAAIGEEAGRRGGHRVFLEVAADNAAARALYSTSGFIQVGSPQPLLPPRRPARSTRWCSACMSRATGFRLEFAIAFVCAAVG